MNPWRRVSRYLVFTTLLVILGACLVAAGLIPGVALREVSGRVLRCDDVPGHGVPTQGARHLSYLGERHVDYISVPPTSGPHMPWLISGGVYRSRIPPEFQVHLLEHGKVLIQYPVGAPAILRNRLEGFARRRPEVVVVAPNSDVHTGIAMTAWQRIDRLPRFDRRRIKHFVDALVRRYDHGWSDAATPCVDSARSRTEAESTPP